MAASSLILFSTVSCCLFPPSPRSFARLYIKTWTSRAELRGIVDFVIPAIESLQRSTLQKKVAFVSQPALIVIVMVVAAVAVAVAVDLQRFAIQPLACACMRIDLQR